MNSPRELVVYVDIDDTLVRSSGSKQIPMTETIRHVRELHATGAKLFAWSTGGAEYARSSVEELGILDCFQAFLPKPHVMLDDQAPAQWKCTIHVYPAALKSAEDYLVKLSG